jgi:pyroglutamyl-peptidase
MARVLLTGFEPFGTFKRNPSWDALELARKRNLLPTGVKLARIPVTYAGAFKALQKAARNFKPGVVVCFGVHGSRDERTIYIERVAHNRNGASADNEGVALPGVILARKPPSLTSQYPHRALTTLLRENGFFTEYSDDAGGYLCNHLYYRASHAFSRRTWVLFVHVPPVGAGGQLKLDCLARATAIVAWHAALVCLLRSSV